MRITGGGANSELWHRILSDVFDMPTVRVHAAGGPAWGACVIAGVGVGALASMTEAEGLGATNDGFLQPDAATARSYRALHRRFDALYPALRAAFRDNDALER
jgi:xylulokinase